MDSSVRVYKLDYLDFLDVFLRVIIRYPALQFAFICIFLCVSIGKASAGPLFLPGDPRSTFALHELQNDGLSSFEYRMHEFSTIQASIAKGGVWLEGGYGSYLNPNLYASCWVSGTSVDQGEHLLGTHTTRGGWTGRVVHGTLEGEWENVGFELGRRNLSQGHDMVSEHQIVSFVWML
jgi:hypothetical protein